MKLDEVADVIKIVATNQLKVPLMLVGPSGVGKSAIVQQVAEEIGYDLEILRLALQEPGDLTGMPDRDRERKKTIWLKPEWMRDIPCKPGILFLDELNRANVETRQSVFQLLTEWRIHTHPFPPNWVIVSAINPDIGEYQVETLDPAMIRRFCWLKVEPDVQVWLDWAVQAGIEGDIIEFISAYDDLLYVEEKFDLSFLKPRQSNWDMLSKLWPYVKRKPYRGEIVMGCVGANAASVFLNFLQSNKARPVRGIDVIYNYMKVRSQYQKQPQDMKYATARQVLSHLANTQKITDEMALNVAMFLEDSPSELIASFITQNKNRELDAAISRMDPKLVKKVYKIATELERELRR